ncbi:neurofilament medium polypeptide-like [Chiloscyllium plagiosum]|uniref:neurofilament medium polypeptide-like n=1 Tax=Chiloscyllium plagiosum TaxID=36176 RepID=UPI001CB7E020|nr:neurofilament medium polypeptide-like [Chiloscyllium plagiosum]
MPRRVEVQRRKSKRLKGQVQEEGETETESQEQADSRSSEMLVLTPRNPIRGSSRTLRSSATARIEEEEAEPVVLQKVKADLDLKQRRMKKEEGEEEQKEEEEDGTEHQETPRSIMVPPVVKVSITMVWA